LCGDIFIVLSTTGLNSLFLQCGIYISVKEEAVLRERQIKRWSKDKKLSLVHRGNKQVSLP